MKIKTEYLVVICIAIGVIVGPSLTLWIQSFMRNYGIELPETYQCPYCGAVFSSQEALDAHIELHHADHEPPPSTDLMDVTRHIDWQVVDDLAGGGIASVYLYVYDADLRKFEGDGSAYKTGTDGTLESGIAYESGQVLKVQAVKSNAKAWYTVIVPKMSKSDADTLTYNPVTLRFFTEIGSTTDPTFTLIHQGTSISDGGEYNKTTSGNTRTFTFSIYNNDDNTGFIESYDPLNDINWYAVVYLKQFGTGYEDISLTGFDGSYEKGTSMWFHKKITATGVNGISKYKVGQTYVWDGGWSFAFQGDFTGYSGTTADWDINVYIYSDPAYREAKSSYGPDSVQLASTFDVDIVE